MTQDSLGDRMKEYEACYQVVLPRRMPVIVRLDGKAFHTLTARSFSKPFDEEFNSYMTGTALDLCKQVQGCVLAYTQSDEISLLLHNYRNLNSEAWFGNQLQKIVSVSASVAAAKFTKDFGEPVHFDSRAFVLPESDVCNYFIWRQQDATRNSVQALAQSIFSPKELHGKNNPELLKMCAEEGAFWTDYTTWAKRGSCVLKKMKEGFGLRVQKSLLIGDTVEHIPVVRQEWTVDEEIPIFSEDREYVERHIYYPQCTPQEKA